MIPSDTTNAIQKKYDEMWRKLSPEQRFIKGLQLIHLSRQMLLAGFKARFPELSEQELKERIVQQVYFSFLPSPES